MSRLSPAKISWLQDYELCLAGIEIASMMQRGGKFDQLPLRR
jgi:hypothetical protein